MIAALRKRFPESDSIEGEGSKASPDTVVVLDGQPITIPDGEALGVALTTNIRSRHMKNGPKAPL